MNTTGVLGGGALAWSVLYPAAESMSAGAKISHRTPGREKESTFQVCDRWEQVREEEDHLGSAIPFAENNPLLAHNGNREQ
jgi:hypothetical protein